MTYTVDSAGTIYKGGVSDGLRRAQAWVDVMSSYRGTVAEPLDPVEDAKRAYVLGEITIEAFEQRLNIAFNLGHKDR